MLNASLDSPALELFAVSPALFVENQGQWSDPAVRYVHNGNGMNVAMTDMGAAFQLFKSEEVESDARDGPTPDPLQELRDDPHNRTTTMIEFSASFVGANPTQPVGLDRSEATFNYFVGDQANWHSDVPSFEKVGYQGLYEGIDLVTWGRRSHLKYEFHVAPGGDYRQIQVQYDGIAGLSIANDGSLIVDLGGQWGTISDDAPYVYQVIDGEQVEVASRFVLVDATTYAFEISGTYDPTRELIMDPQLDWSTYLGGSGGDSGVGIAVDANGNAFITGEALSYNWVPAGRDAFVAKLSSSGAHVWSTYLGGFDYDYGRAIAVDAAGSAFIAGNTASPGWTSGGFDTSYNGNDDVFVVKLSSSGAHLWSTYLGGDGHEYGGGIAVDAAGSAFVTGTTSTAGWVSGGFDTSQNGILDALVVKLSSSGAHVWSTYLGGASEDYGNGIAVDAGGSAFITGFTGSSGWVSGGYDTTFNSLYGGADAFVAKLSSNGAHVWSTYLGGDGHEYGYGIAVDVAGSAFVAGPTESAAWVSGGFDTSYNGSMDAYVVKLSSNGVHLWSTYLGGNDYDDGHGIAVDAGGTAFITGFTGSSGWVSGGYDTSYNGNGDAFVAKISGAGTPELSRQTLILSPPAFNGPGDDLRVHVNILESDTTLEILGGVAGGGLQTLATLNGLEPGALPLLLDLAGSGLIYVDRVAIVSGRPVLLNSADALNASPAQLEDFEQIPATPGTARLFERSIYDNVARLYEWTRSTAKFEPLDLEDHEPADEVRDLGDVDWSRRTIILTHGWNDRLDLNAEDEYIERFAGNLAADNIDLQFNILAVDWYDDGSPLGSDPNNNRRPINLSPVNLALFAAGAGIAPVLVDFVVDAKRSAQNAAGAAKALAHRLIEQVAGVGGPLRPQDLMLIGHSNGAGFMANLARELYLATGDRVAELVSLDAPWGTRSYSDTSNAAGFVDRLTNYYIPLAQSSTLAALEFNLGFGAPMLLHGNITNFQLNDGISAPGATFLTYAHSLIPLRFAESADFSAGGLSWGFRGSHFVTGAAPLQSGHIWFEQGEPGYFARRPYPTQHTLEVAEAVADAARGAAAAIADSVVSVFDTSVRAIEGFNSWLFSPLEGAIEALSIFMDANSPALAALDVQVPADTAFLSFDLSVLDSGNNDTLVVAFNEHVLGEVDLAGYQLGGGGNVDLWIGEYAGQTGTLSFYLPSDEPSAAQFLISNVEFGIVDQLDVSPSVTEVLVSSSQWSNAFRDWLEQEDLGVGGYRLDVGNTTDGTLPWAGLDRVEVIFNRDTIVDQNHLALVGVEVPHYLIQDFSYDPLRRAATWTFTQPLDADHLRLWLDGSTRTPVQDKLGRALDGEPQSALPSGDGVPGGSFQLLLSTLPGDISQDGVVDGADYTLWADGYLQPLASGADGRADLNGDGQIGGGDYTIWADHYGQTLTEPPPGDATLDSIVDSADYNVWVNNYGQHFGAASHAEGDFNFDGLVDGGDYTLWADHYGGSTVAQQARTAVAWSAAVDALLAGEVRDGRWFLAEAVEDYGPDSGFERRRDRLSRT